ncbi:hypothetical protein COW64_25760, partial [bacterium (Candidatus Blackallbacteria) CG18_big_fil_WC_8_21_14_2_50_49_26]
MTPKSFLQPLLAFCLLSASACTSLPFLNQSLQTSSLQVSQETGLSAYQAKQRALWQQFKNKPAYSGPLKIAIHTNLLNPGLGGRQIDLTHQLDSQGFQIQSVPQGPLVFQETFTKGKGNYEVIRGFQLTNTSQRYTLHIEAKGKKTEGQISVNINGTDWIKPGEFKDQEAEINSLLLNANNSMRVRIQGKEGTSYTVSLIEGGEAGTVLRRRGNLHKEDENQAHHVSQNDTNIFNPNDPNSLGGVTPYQGHLEGEDVPPSVTGVVIDGGLPLQFEAGTLILRLREPKVILPILQSKYGATVIKKAEIPGHPLFTYYYLQFDLSKSPVAQIAPLIRAYRNKIPAAFNDFVFGSLSGLQTFAILMDIVVTHESQILTWDLNTYKAPPLQNLAAIEPNDWNIQNQTPVTGNNKGWWLRDTYVREAWNLSLGTGVNVAYIDQGFKGIFNGTTPESELGHRLLFTPSGLSDGYGVQNLVAEQRKSEVEVDPTNALECRNRVGFNTKYCGNDHGATTVMAGFAQRDNNWGTAGVAPNANLIPYNTDRFIFTYALALLYVSQFSNTHNIDVIGFNKQDQIKKGWTPAWIPNSDPDRPNNDDPYTLSLLKVVLAYVTEVQNIPVVIAAGNDGSSCPSVETGTTVKTIKKDCNYEFIPASYDGAPSPFDPSETINLIIAGGADRRNVTPVPSPSPLGNHNANSNKDITGWNGSAIGNGYIWTPATQIEVLDFSYNPIPLINQKPGTSFSCPILTGVVALMKSRNPNLTPQEIKDILRNSPTKIDITHDSGVPSPLRLTNEPFIDAQYAVEEAIKKKTDGSKPEQYIAKDYFALISGTATDKKARLNQSIVTSSAAFTKEKTVLRSVADNIWNGDLASSKLVKIKGWSELTIGHSTNSLYELEVLNANEVCSVPKTGSCTSPKAGFAPLLTSATAIPNKENTAYIVTLEGENLIADLRAGVTQPIVLVFDGTTKFGSALHQEMTFAPADIQEINQDGTKVVVQLLNSRLIDRVEPSDKLTVGTYAVAFKNTMTNQISTNSSSSFGIKSEGGNTLTFESLLPPPAGAHPAGFGLKAFYDPNSNIPITARAGDTIGFFMAHARTRNISIEIQGKNAVVKAISDDLISMTVPAGLAVGNLNVLFKSDQGSFQIDNLLNYTSPYP